jgi:hypothetical protein
LGEGGHMSPGQGRGRGRWVLVLVLVLEGVDGGMSEHVENPLFAPLMLPPRPLGGGVMSLSGGM